ncbi:hypothetical protein AS026_33035 [Rhizobium altiplani]|uniref:Uncharacterized protein n=1 Tax=Rhizobium altiplani TaxID=1864509 RepID=A0A125Q9A0_9HYPH|nr:hypothetical protein [Rhizobium altiplani]KWV56675.1 hypothetical protein AS026_33035 [Rhizobium altiplani]
MGKLKDRIIVTAIVTAGSWWAYEAYRAGNFARPTMPEGAFSLSYPSGLRAIMVNIPNERKTRRYMGFPSDVPFYLEKAWSFCSPPNTKEQKQLDETMKVRDLPGARIEAVCKIKVDGNSVVRGVITSVPRL